MYISENLFFQVTLTFSNLPKSNSDPIACRTGRDASDPDSGGQPVSISLSFQYELQPTVVSQLYRKFSTAYDERLLQYVRQSVSNAAQAFHPQQFWTHRHLVAEAIRNTVKADLLAQAGVSVMATQLLQVDFSKSFEESIVGIQLAVQTRTTSEYAQKVVKVLKDVDIQRSATDAQCAVIDSEAQAKASVLLSRANAEGFSLLQKTKAESYDALGDALGFNSSEIVQYFRLKSIQSHNR